jgi:hypothetical protein
MEKPILFNTEMVKAIMEGRKTVTRRVIKNKYTNANIEWFENKYGKRLVYMQNDIPPDVIHEDGSRTCHIKMCEEIKKPYKVGDILYVREKWWRGDIIGTNDEIEESDITLYYADGYIKENLDYEAIKWKPSIHMPKEAARIFLRVTNVKVEKLQTMNFKDAKKEGFDIFYEFTHLWDKTIKKEDLDQYGWQANPWVWVIEFEVVMKNSETGEYIKVF